MQYDIRLSIGTRYGSPSDQVRALLHLLPVDEPGRQIVRSRLLTVAPAPSERRESHDFFRNAITLLAFHAPIDAIEVTLLARVECLATSGSFDLSPDLPGLAAEIQAHRGLDPTAPHHFLGPSTRIAPDPAISAFAREQVRAGMTVARIVVAIGEALNRAMRFNPDATHVDTAPAEAFADRHGVCQDYSHIMIAALRALGIPAGYVSGFLRTVPPPGQARLEGADAMHAWVSAWCGTEAGWLDYDPTNGSVVAQDHIVVARGRDYADVSPIKAVLRTWGSQASHQRVDVVPL